MDAVAVGGVGRDARLGVLAICFFHLQSHIGFGSVFALISLAFDYDLLVGVDMGFSGLVGCLGQYRQGRDFVALQIAKELCVGRGVGMCAGMDCGWGLLLTGNWNMGVRLCDTVRVPVHV